MMLSRGARPIINNESRISTVVYELSNQDEGGRDENTVRHHPIQQRKSRPK